MIHLLKQLSQKQNKPVLYIANQEFTESDLRQVFQTEIYQHFVLSEHFLGLDNFKLETFHKTLFPNSNLFVIPQGLSDPYTSKFIAPLSHAETFQYLQILSPQPLLPLVVSTIIDYSAGIPKLAEKLVAYFESQKNLSIDHLLADVFIQSDLNYIYDNFVVHLTEELNRIWIALLAVGKPLEDFARSLNCPIETSALTLFKSLGFDRVIKSRLILTFFRKRIGFEAIKTFRQHGIKEMLGSEQKQMLAIWTANSELKFFNNQATIEEIGKSIFKGNKLYSRIDWTKSRINNEPVTSEISVAFGSEVRFILGKRNANNARNKNYTRLNRQYWTLISKGNGFSRRNMFDEAKNYYHQVDALQFDSGTPFMPDSKAGRVRLANLLRILGYIDEAITMCEPIVRSTPNPYAALCLATCHFLKGNLSVSLGYLENCLAWKPNYVNARIWQARVFIHLKNYESTEFILANINETMLSPANRIVFIFLNYLLLTNNKDSFSAKNAKWQHRALNYISREQKNFRNRELAVIFLFLERLGKGGKEFDPIKSMFDSSTIPKGISIELYWWRQLADVS